MRRLAPGALALLAVAVAGCGGGPRVTETREMAPFDRIEVHDGIDVDVVPGSGREVQVRAGRDVLDRVRTESSGGVLEVDLGDRGIVIGPDPLGDVRVQVSAASVRGLRIEGSGDVTLTDIDADELEIDVEGSGEIDASGTVDRLRATIEGAGDANLSELAVRTAQIDVQGAGDADLNVSEALDVDVQGAGDVTYRGDPTVQSNIEGAGDLRHEEP
jgi:hypothetical protein